MAHKNFLGRIILLFLLLFLTGCSLSPGGKALTEDEFSELSETEDTSLDDSLTEEATEAVRENQIWVHVCGEVKQPGVYGFSEGGRVFDAVEAAGGFTEEADSDSLNLAGLLSDEGKIYVPSKSEKQENSGSSVDESDGKVNLNTATLEDLMTLPGIGEKRAESILKLREQKGGFQKIEDLLEAEGIKEGIFENIKDFIKV